MLPPRFRRIVKYGTAGLLLGSSAYLLQKNDWEMSTVGVMRFGRAAYAAVYIVLDYKLTLRKVDSQSEEYKILKSKLHTRSAERLRDMCCKNGGAFIKVGQHMGTLEYLLPQEYVATMKVLHSKAPQSSVEELCKVFEEDIGQKVDDVFTSFSPEPLGTASLAQVHKATTKDGKVLAVKIQHPKVKAHSFVDIKTMEFLIRQVCWVFPDFQYVWLAEETRKNLPLELDFVREGHHCERVAKLFSHFNFLKENARFKLANEFVEEFVGDPGKVGGGSQEQEESTFLNVSFDDEVISKESNKDEMTVEENQGQDNGEKQEKQKRLYKCGDCSYSTKAPSNLYRHRRSIHEKRRFECELCSKNSVDPSQTVPKIYWEYTNERVLTMEFCEGGQVDDREYMKKHHIDVNEVSRDLGKLYSEMIFVNGYVHCDPHPGNVLVNKTTSGTQIVLLDHGLYQSLTDDFRINYCKLWMSLIQADLKRIEKYAKRLNVGELYALFACMLTARSWESIQKGIEKIPLTQSESQEIIDNVGTYVIEISEVLNKIPRQLLLIMKTNDVLRGIEASLNTRANASYFINMSKCCIRALGDNKLDRSSGIISCFRIRLFTQFQLLKIDMYEFFLWLKSSVLVKYLFSKSSKSVSAS